MNYVIAFIRAKDPSCRLENLKEVPSSHQLRFGISRAKGFPDDAHFRMSDDFPKATALSDVLDNTDLLLVGSERFVECLKAIPGALHQNELLPVSIVNHKGRKEKTPYFIVNQLNHIKCLDESKCVGRRSKVNPEQFASLETMVIDEAQIDPGLMLFRAVQYPDFPLVRRDLATALEAEKLTGISFEEIEDYEF